MPYINERWQGGMLTNFNTISKRIGKMKEYQRMRDSGEFEAMIKKEALMLTRELVKLERNLGGIRDMTKPPDAVFVLDTKKEHIAVTEARKLGIPIVAVVDTNCDPDLVDFAIPGNDDAIRAGELMSRVISDAVQEGRYIRSKRGGGDGGPKRNVLQEAEVAQQQAEARAQAAAQAAERDARLAAANTGPADAPEPVAGGAAEPVAADATEPVAGDVAEPVAGDAAEPVAADATEPVAEPVAADAPEPVAEPVAADATEPAAEPVAADATEPAAAAETVDADADAEATEDALPQAGDSGTTST
jgi:small subunit ribosomal protein S2